MTTREGIEFNFRKALSQADRIDEVADRLHKLSSDRFGSTLQILSENWNGENACLYLKKGSELREEMTRVSAEFHRIASDIRTVARRIRNADIAALNIALKMDR